MKGKGQKMKRHGRRDDYCPDLIIRDIYCRSARRSHDLSCCIGPGLTNNDDYDEHDRALYGPGKQIIRSYLKYCDDQQKRNPFQSLSKPLGLTTSVRGGKKLMMLWSE